MPASARSGPRHRRPATVLGPYPSRPNVQMSAASNLKMSASLAFGRWMIAAGPWRDRKQRKSIHQPRRRRECVGELVQVDGSEHWWFEDRGPQCTLLVFVDDATSRLMHLQFVKSVSTFAYFRAARAGGLGQTGRVLSRQAQGLSGQASRCAWRRWHDPVWPRSASAQHRHHLRQFESSQGSGRTCQQRRCKTVW